MSERPHGTTWLELYGFPLNLVFAYFSKIYRGNSRFIKIFTRITGTLHEDQYTFFITSWSFPLRMRNVSNKSRRENQNTHFVFCNFFFENCAAY
jgi:hypothetical protein